MHDQLICEAIKQHRQLRFRYKDYYSTTVVEPYVFGVNDAEHRALRAWLIAGATHSDTRSRWRMYLASEMKDVQILDDVFEASRPGFTSFDHGFRRILCKVSAER